MKNKPDNKNLQLKNEKLNISTKPDFAEELDEVELNLVSGGLGYSVETPTGSSTSSILKKLDDKVSSHQQKIG